MPGVFYVRDKCCLSTTYLVFLIDLENGNRNPILFVSIRPSGEGLRATWSSEIYQITDSPDALVTLVIMGEIAVKSKSRKVKDMGIAIGGLQLNTSYTAAIVIGGSRGRRHLPYTNFLGRTTFRTQSYGKQV